jgi:hypothetical protein
MTAVLSTMAMAMVKSTGTEVRKAVNQYEGVKARMAAESGVAYLSRKLKDFQISGSPSSSQLLSDLATYLNSELPDGTVSYTGGQIQINGLTIDSTCGTFTGALCIDASNDNLELEVEGQSSQAHRNIGLQYELVPGSQGIFEKGIIAGGPISLTGNSHIEGANSPDEAELLTLTDQAVAYDLRGNSNIEGDIYATNPDGECSLAGNVEIGGVSAGDPEVTDHIHFGVGEVEIPRPSASVFEPYATNVLSGSTSGNRTFSNIRIPAGTNPTFAGNINLRGVIYIEYPNNVTFAGNLNVRGVVVTEDPGPGTTANNKVQFCGNTTLQGVETLPSDPEFDGLRDMTGSSVLAPGFEVKFTGNFGTVGGTLAAEKFTFVGNSSATVKGAIISLGDDPYTMTGNAHITIDRSEYDQVPPGFNVPTTLSTVATTYVEY